jgi:hypothetical protein
MALQLGALRDALLDAKVSPEKASAAAEEVAGYDNRLASIEAQLSVLKWMVGTNLVLTIGVLGRLLAHP